MGIVYDLFHEEVFSAVKGKGSFLNGQPIRVSNAEKLSDTMIGMGAAKRELADENFVRFRRVFGQCQDVRRIGSAALELAYTACGRQLWICILYWQSDIIPVNKPEFYWRCNNEDRDRKRFPAVF